MPSEYWVERAEEAVELDEPDGCDEAGVRLSGL